MNKKKKYTKLEKILFIGVLSVIMIGGISIVGANLSFMDRMADKAGEVYGKLFYQDNPNDIPTESEEIVGGSGGTFQTSWYKQNGVVTEIQGGDMLDASTTLTSIRNPFGSTASSTEAGNSTLEQYARDFLGTYATTTVDMVTVHVTGVATSTIQITCGAAANRWSAPVYDLISLHIVTSTLGYYENNMVTTTAGFAFGTGGGKTSKIFLTHDYSYFNCHATGSPLSDAWGIDADADTDALRKGLTGPTNTFTGKIKARFRQLLE